MKEVFKPITINKNYSISNLGEVRNEKTGRIMGQRATNNGIYQVTLCTNSVKTIINVGREVANTFIMPLEEHNVVFFLDGDHSNIQVSNLQVWENIGYLKQYLLECGHTTNPMKDSKVAKRSHETRKLNSKVSKQLN